MIIESGRTALARQQHIQAVGKLETYNEELLQLKVCLCFIYCISVT